MINPYFKYKGFLISQHPDIKRYFKKLFDEVKPNRVLEIGTLYGGLTLILRELFDGRLRTYDINKNLLCGDIEIITKDIFTDIKEIEKFNPDIILCDGGDKIKEVNELGHLAPIVMAHDYAPDEEYFRDKMFSKRWNWMEIQDSDITLKGYEPYMTEFKEVAWLCLKRS